jgi:hypothetical protein
MSKGSIYILKNPALRENMLKIGRTEGTPQKRARQLFTTGLPDEFIVSYEEDVPDCVLAEKLVHEKLDKYRYNPKREFFVLSLQEAISAVQEVIQREIYQNAKSYTKGFHRLNENMTLRWLLQDQDVIMQVRYRSMFDTDPDIIDIWQAKDRDQLLITNRKCDDPSDLAKDKSINGYISEVIDIYPGDRIVWVGKRQANPLMKQADYTTLSILNSHSYAKMVGFLNQIEIHPGGFPIPFGELSEHQPAQLMQATREAFEKVKKLGLPWEWGHPDLRLF